jgi:hypothetical protein
MIVKTLRKKFVNSTLTNKKCSHCNKTYPRTKEFFYAWEHQSVKNAFNFESFCITCKQEQNKKWKVKNRSKNSEQNIKYRQSEKGHFREMWHGVRKSRHGCAFKSYEEFFNCWIEQQKIYGTKCPYSGVEMTRTKGANFHGERKRQTETNLSKDRILSSKPYSKENMMFISWKVNNEKGNISPEIAKKYLQFVKQRFGNDENNDN